MLFCEFEVRSATTFIYVGGAGIDATEQSKFRSEHFVADNAALLDTFKRTKEKSTVLRIGPPTATPNCRRWKKGSGLNRSRCNPG